MKRSDINALTRREFIAALMAGGVMTAQGLWMPGTELISIPKSIIVPPDLVRIILEGDGAPVPVGVNGEIITIPRHITVNVAERFLSVLDNAVEHHTPVFDSDGKCLGAGGRPHLVYPYRRL